MEQESTVQKSLLTQDIPLAAPRKTAYGMLSQYANPELRKHEEEGFALAMKEKYKQ